MTRHTPWQRICREFERRNALDVTHPDFLSYQDLADASGLNKQSIYSNLANGILPSIDRAEAIAKALGLTLTVESP